MNTGDSKAVMYRGGVPVPLSVEHRPDRQDEMVSVAVVHLLVFFVFLSGLKFATQLVAYRLHLVSLHLRINNTQLLI